MPIIPPMDSQDCRPRSALAGGRLLGVGGSIQSAATTLTDWHVRGDDLIAVYETGQPDAARVDLLWHAAPPAAGDPWLDRLDLLVSCLPIGSTGDPMFAWKLFFPRRPQRRAPGSLGGLFDAPEGGRWQSWSIRPI